MTGTDVSASLRRAAWLAGAVVAGCVTLAPRAGANSTADPRLRVVDYRPMAVLSLTAFLGYHVHLQFAPDEHFINLAAGDTSGIDVGVEANHLLLKPKQPNAGMNLTILTDRRVYYVDYRAMSRPPRVDEAVYSIVFRYPASESATDRTRAETAVDDGRPIPARPVRNRDYWFCGSKSIKPASATDDGLQMRLTFAPRTALPAAYAAGPDGVETLVNSHVENDSIVIHALVARLVLRRGRAVGCVVDHSGVAAGERATSGTIDRSIERVDGGKHDEARR